MLVLLTHSATYHSLNTIWTGSLDTELTNMGVCDARALISYSDVKVDRAFVAPAAHIQQFAKIVLDGKEYEVVPEFQDRSMGTLQGRDYRETMQLFARRNWLAWMRDYWQKAPEGESYFDIAERVLTAFRTKILPITNNDRVAVIAAPAVLQIIIAYINKTEESDVPHIHVEPCVPHVINGDL